MKKLTFKEWIYRKRIVKKNDKKFFSNEICLLKPENVIDSFINMDDMALLQYNFSDNHAVPLSIMCGLASINEKNAIHITAFVAFWDRLMLINRIYDLNSGKLIGSNCDEFFWDDIITVNISTDEQNTFNIHLSGDKVRIPIDFSISEAKIMQIQILRQFMFYRRIMCEEIDGDSSEEYHDWGYYLEKLRRECGLIK